MTNLTKTKSGTLAKTAGAAGLAVVACAACCAPLIAGPVIALVAAGGAGLILAGQIGLAALVLLGAGGYLFVRQRRLAAKRAAAASCNCARDAGCNVGDACELPSARGAAS